jgi:hypothetical protein
MLVTFSLVGLEAKVLLWTWLNALLNLSWVGLPAVALMGERVVAALFVLLGERAMMDLHLWCDLWKDGSMKERNLCGVLLAKVSPIKEHTRCSDM